MPAVPTARLSARHKQHGLMSDSEPEVAIIDSDIARVRKRIAELEALAADDTRRGASPRLVRALVAEWRSRLGELERRRDALLRSHSDEPR